MKRKKRKGNTNGTGGKRHSAEVRQKAVTLLTDKENPMKPALVAEQLKVPISAVMYWYKVEQERLATVNGHTVPNSDNIARNARVSDALAFLRHARDKTMKSIRLGKQKQPTHTELLALLALDSLEGP